MSTVDPRSPFSILTLGAAAYKGDVEWSSPKAKRPKVETNVDDLRVNAKSTVALARSGVVLSEPPTPWRRGKSVQMLVNNTSKTPK